MFTFVSSWLLEGAVYQLGAQYMFISLLFSPQTVDKPQLNISPFAALWDSRPEFPNLLSLTWTTSLCFTSLLRKVQMMPVLPGGGKIKEATSGLVGVLHMLVPFPLTEIMDSLSIVRLALSTIPSMRSDRCTFSYISCVALSPVKASHHPQR